MIKKGTCHTYTTNRNWTTGTKEKCNTYDKKIKIFAETANVRKSLTFKQIEVPAGSRTILQHFTNFHWHIL